MNYFITTLTSNPFGSRTHGYFSSLEKAIDAVERNVGGMDECLYSYCVIEPCPEGIYGFLQNKLDKDETIWYKWVHPEKENGHWEKCERPEEYKNICSFFS